MAKHPFKFVLFFIFLCNSSVIWAQRAGGPGPRVTQIRGVVSLDNGVPAANVMVRLESYYIAYQAETETDRQGKFFFGGIPATTYVIKVKYPGYQEDSVHLDVSVASTAYELITLKPLPGSQPPTVPPVGSAGTLNVKQALIPKEAQKQFEEGEKLLLKKKDPQASVGHFKKAIELYPSFPEAYQFLGVAYMQSRRLDEAQSALEKAVQLRSNLGAAQLALGVCRNQRGKFAAAEQPLMRGLELMPEAFDGHYELGRTYFALNRWDDAEIQARKSATLKPDFAPAHVLLGNILLRKRNAPGALQEFKEYLRLDPSGPLAPPTRDLLARIEKALKSKH